MKCEDFLSSHPVSQIEERIMPLDGKDEEFEVHSWSVDEINRRLSCHILGWAAMPD